MVEIYRRSQVEFHEKKKIKMSFEEWAGFLDVEI